MVHQPELFDPARDSDLATLRNLLLRADSWLTRRQLRTLTGWTDRRIRDVCEHMGREVIRGPIGFRHRDRVSREEFPIALTAADRSISQGKIMIRYGLAVKRDLHARYG